MPDNLSVVSASVVDTSKYLQINGKLRAKNALMNKRTDARMDSTLININSERMKLYIKKDNSMSISPMLFPAILS